MILTIDKIRKMTPEEIAANWDAIGRVLAAKPKRPEPAPHGQLTREHLIWMTPEEIADRWGEVALLLSTHNEEDEQNEQ